MAGFVETINSYITEGSKTLKGPKNAALIAAIFRIISTGGYFFTQLARRNGGSSSCNWEAIHQFNIECIKQFWSSRSASHGWGTFFNILDCISMLLMIWVFDGIRTINKDKDIGSLMVGCMEVATIINIITTLLELGIGNTASYVSRSWKITGDLWAHLEIAYYSARGSFSWLFTIDDFIMVIPYFWCFMLANNNDSMPHLFGTESLVLALCSFLFFLFGIFELVNVFSFTMMMIVGIIYILVRFIWLFHAFSIFSKA